MTKLKNHNLGFFLTEGVSLQDWKKAGIFSREIEVYNILAEHFNKIYIFSAGNKEELKYQKYLKPNIKIIHNNSKYKGRLYYFLLPFFHKKTIKKCSFFKTNQMLGSQALVIIKLFINKKAKIISRTGHQLSFVRKNKKQRLGYLYALLLEFFTYKICDKALVTSKQMRDSIVKNYKIKKDKVEIIANYINTETFSPNPNIKKYSDRIIYIGRIIPQKNLPNLIKALKNTNVTLDLIGNKTDTSGLEKLAKNLGVKINFPLSNVPNNEIPDILNKYKIFILPSKWEGMPKTLLEAMSCGLSCIGTNVEGTKEVIRSGENGILAQTNPESLREKILKLISDELLQKKLGENARQFILNNYSIENEIKKEIEIYKKLL